ncbi:MAG: signal recognition particle-docking protein FtsY [Candidatus Woesearchaeota archaeon]
MFKFLKEKLKKGISAFSKKIDETGEEEVIEEVKEEKGIEEPITEKPIEPEKLPEKEEVKEIPVEVSEEKKLEEPKQGFFKRFFKKKPEAAPEIQDIAPASDAEVTEEITPQPPVEEDLPKESKKIPEQIRDEDIPKEVPQEEKQPLEKVKEEPRIEEQKETPLKKDAAELPEEQEIKPESTPETIDVPEPKEVVEEESVEELGKEEPETLEEKEIPEPAKKGFFGKLKEKVVTKKISAEKFQDLFWTLEVTLLENNVALEVIEKLKNNLQQDIVDQPIRRNKIEETIILSLRKSIENILSSDTIDIIKKCEEKKPLVICFVGINGSGKTTTIAKVAKMFLDNNKKVVLAAADTFRAAAIDQLKIHADNLKVKMIKHDYGSDPAAVAFDAVKYAESKDVDVVLVDTAGRLHSNINLIDEMKKIVRVAKPDLKLFVGEAITGNDCIEQAVKFNEAIEIDGIILSKADIDEKGGASISVGYVTKKPILFLGTGQNYQDLKEFNKEEIISSLGLSA